MEYRTTVSTQMPTFVSCNNCGLWLPVESSHSCTQNRDITAYNSHIHYNLV